MDQSTRYSIFQKSDGEKSGCGSIISNRHYLWIERIVMLNKVDLGLRNKTGKNLQEKRMEKFS